MSRMRQAYLKELLKNDLVYIENCSKEENKKYNDLNELEDGELPDDIEQSSMFDVPPEYFKYKKCDFTDNEMIIYLLAKQNM